MNASASFSLESVTAVSLARVPAEGPHSDDKEVQLIRLEGIDYYFEFGAGLPDEQRAFLALFLLQNRLATIHS